MVVTIAGKKHYLWRAVDQDGFVLDALVQSRRDKKAAKRLLRKLLKKQGRAPRVMVTDKLRSYGIVKLLGGSRELGELDGGRAGLDYAACVMPQTSCHAWKARARSARVAGIWWRGRRKRLLIWSWAERKR
jgi:transposase-like protein